MPLSLLIDTGSSVTIINPKIYHKIPVEDKPTLDKVSVDMTLADGKKLMCMGKGCFILEINNEKFVHTVWVADINLDGILGYDFLQSYACCLDLDKGEMSFDHLPHSPYDSGKENAPCYRIAIDQDITITPESEMLISAHFTEKPDTKQTGIIEPTVEFLYEQPMLLAKVLVNSDSENLLLRVINPGTEKQILYKDMIVATFEPVSEIMEANKPHPSNNQCNNISTTENVESLGKEIHESLKVLIEKSTIGLNDKQSMDVKELLHKHCNVFAKDKFDLGYCDIVQHDINTGNAPPVREAPRRIPIHQKEIEREEVKAMLKRGVIEESSSPWAANCVLVKKKDGTYRHVLDFRRINQCIIPDSYALPKIDETLDRLSDSSWYCSLDLQSGYWQLALDPKSRPKTAFHSSLGLFQMKVLPMGLINSSACFSRVMEKILRGLVYETLVVYLDDILIFGKEFDQILNRIDTVFTRLGEAGLKLNPKKCDLFKREVAFLGHVVSGEGVATDPAKAEAVQNWPRPNTVTELRSFLGTCSYYRKFIKGFSQIAKPLHVLTEKNRVFCWNDEAETAFQTLKAKLISTPILAYPNDTDEYIVDCDASGTGLGAVLSQKQGEHERVIGYYSKTLNKAERNYCVTRRELLAIVVSVKHFHHYLMGKKFLVRTDHGALRWLMNFKNPEAQVARWIEILGSYNFDIEHRPGRYHGNADGLSRRPCEGDECKQCDRIMTSADEREVHVPARLPKANVSESVKGDGDISGMKQGESVGPRIAKVTKNSKNKPNESWIQGYSKQDLRQAQLDDLVIGQVLRLMESAEAHDENSCNRVPGQTLRVPEYRGVWDDLMVMDGVVYKISDHDQWDKRPLLVLPEKLRKGALQQLHDTRTGGHLGRKKTWKKVRERFYWNGYHRNVID